MYFMNSEKQETAEKRSGMDPKLGHVRGKVVDMDGYGLGHCRIWARETGMSTRTDAHGNFVLINMRPAIYSFVAESEGYSPSTMVDVPVESGDNPGLNFVMFPNYNRMRTGRRHGAIAFA